MTTPRPHRRAYFYLSYGQLRDVNAPAAAAIDGHDPGVRAFFKDLCDAVRELPGIDPDLIPGSIYPPIDSSTSTNDDMLDLLGAAEVFVPLYAQQYLVRSWPQREKRAFLERLRSAPPELAHDHVQPVLWYPCIGVYASDEDKANLVRAEEFGHDVSAYDNGLGAMQKFKAFKENYPMLVRRLAQHIVDAARIRPLGPSRPLSAADLGSHRSPAHETFVVVVLAPMASTVPLGRRADSYGTRSSDWRLAGPGGRRVADIVADEARALRFTVEILDDGQAMTRLGECPGLLLIDPWLAEQSGGAEQIETAVRNLPSWAGAVIFSDPDDAQYGADGTLADQFAGRQAPGTRDRIDPALGQDELRRLLRGDLVPHIRKRYVGQVSLPRDDEREST